jgi:hypothetical protein
MATVKRNTSVYDNIPALESWYQEKCEPSPIEAARSRRKRANCGNVSFSAAPPAVYKYDEQQYLEEIEHSRPPHRRQSSSESGKLLRIWIRSKPTNQP